MLKLLCILLTTLNFCTGDTSDDYIDPVIDLLLNGGNSNSSEVVEVAAPPLISGIWKCGNCTDIADGTTQGMVYSEDTYLDGDKEDDDEEIQIELIFEGMRCVTVAADRAGVVRLLSGACDGGAVTLHMTPTQHFTVRVYI